VLREARARVRAFELDFTRARASETERETAREREILENSFLSLSPTFRHQIPLPPVILRQLFYGALFRPVPFVSVSESGRKRDGESS
jgi:hypothetical protein